MTFNSTEQVSIEPVSIQFQDCDAGWIRFTVVAGEKAVVIRASHVYDPFPDFICWMHAILVGVEECSFRVDQAGAEAEFVARRRPRGNLLFLVRDPTREPCELLCATVSRRQLIETFYTGIRMFSRSPEYRQDEWAFETLAERFRPLSPLAGDGHIIQHLTNLNREELGKSLFEAAPSYTIQFPDAPDGKAKLARAIGYFLDPEDPIKSAGLYRTPNEWRIPDDYDDWPERERTDFVLGLLREHVNSWDGCKLDQLKSIAIERFLEHPEMDIDESLP